MSKHNAEMSPELATDIQRQRNEWRRKGWAIPDIRGCKQEWFSIVKELIRLVSVGQANDLNSVPKFRNCSNPQSWRNYAGFLKGIGLVSNQAGMLRLSKDGETFCNNPTKRCLADLIQDRIRLFGEVLEIISIKQVTVEEVDKTLCANYGLSWVNLSNTRRRMDWLEVLGLIQGMGSRKWQVTDEGKDALAKWCLVTPEALETTDVSGNDLQITPPPEEIAVLLQQLKDNPQLHQKRNTYNIWAPSPNRIENLRTIIQFASESVGKAEFFQFIEETFNLKTSSVDSMLPFLKASGLLEEVGRSIYRATLAAKAWVETGSDLDFIRILHANMRFVGEMLVTTNDDTVRNDLYTQAKEYGLNTEKARWIAGFMIEAGLLEEPQYLHLKTTALGRLFAESLPLAEKPQEDQKKVKEPNEDAVDNVHVVSELDLAILRLQKAAINPNAEGKAAGVAFEEAIAEMFRLMGFEARRIGGAGDTDVVIRWIDKNEKSITAIADGKSKSGGHVSHSDISDIAIDTHKDKNGADYVAIIGPDFSGDTIRNHAKKKSFALIKTAELCEIAQASKNLGLCLDEIALLFRTPNGLSELEELMASKQRKLDIISAVIAKFRKEQEVLGGLSPRDLFLLLRDSGVSPSLEELLSAFQTLSGPEIGMLQVKTSTRSPENTVYSLVGAQGVANSLRALASAIDKGMKI